MAADVGSGIHLVRRTGPGLTAAKIDVGLHEIAPTLGDPALTLGVLQDEVRVDEIDRSDVDRRRHTHLPAERDELLGEVQAGLAVEDAPVDVHGVDIDELGGAADAAEFGDDPHGEGNGRTLLPRQHRLLVLGEVKEHTHTLVVRTRHRHAASRVGTHGHPISPTGETAARASDGATLP